MVDNKQVSGVHQRKSNSLSNTLQLGAAGFPIRPPIPPGEKILENFQYCALFPRYKQHQSLSDASAALSKEIFATDPNSLVDQSGETYEPDTWVLTMSKLVQSSGFEVMQVECEKELQFNNPEWLSALVPICDTTTGIESAWLLERTKTYKFTLQDNGDLAVVHFTRAQKFKGKTEKLVFFRKVLTDLTVQESPVERMLFVAQPTDASHPPTVYDFYDQQFQSVLPFTDSRTGLVVNLASIAANKISYLLFAVRSVGDGVANTIYCINEATFFKKLADKETLQLADFFYYDLQKEFKGVRPTDIYPDYIYIDTDDRGSQQLAVCGDSDTGEVVLVILKINATNAFELVGSTSFETGLTDYPIIAEIESPTHHLRRLVNPNGTPCLSVMSKGLSKDRKPYVHFDLWQFDPDQETVDKRFVHQSHCVVSISGYNGALLSEFYRCHYDFAEITGDAQQSLNLNGIFVSHRLAAIDSTNHSTQLLPKPVLSISFYVAIEHAKGVYQFKEANQKQTVSRFIDVNDFDQMGAHLWIPKAIPFTAANLNRMGFFHAVNVDFTGDSIVVGSPRVTLDSSSIQVIGLWRSVPFDSQAQQSLPNVSVSSSKSVMTGLTKSTHSSWHAGVSVSAGYSGSIASVNGHFGYNFGSSSLNMDSDQTGTSLHITSGISNTDMLQGYGSLFYVCQYPLFRRNLFSTAFGYLTVLIPNGFEDVLLDAAYPRFAYDQDYELGCILSALDAKKPGYDPDSLWFDREMMSCTADTQGGGTSLTYSKNTSTHSEEQTSHEDGFNASVSFSLHGGGAHFNTSAYYTRSNVKNSATSTMRSDDLTITFHTGSVSDSQYEYTITPIVYSHKDNNALMMSYDVELVGPGWHSLYSRPHIVMFRVYPFTTNAQLNRFTHDIRFVENKDGTVDITLNIFNNSFTASSAIACKVFTGAAIYIDGRDPDLRNCKLLGTLKHASLEAIGRKTLSLNKQKLESDTVITVKLYLDGFEDFASELYWGIYPYDKFTSSHEQLQVQAMHSLEHQPSAADD